jgi:hypothetical protein
MVISILLLLKSPMVAEERFRGEQLIALTRAISWNAAIGVRHIVVAVTVAAIEEVWGFWTVRLVGKLPHKRLIGNFKKRRLS